VEEDIGHVDEDIVENNDGDAQEENDFIIEVGKDDDENHLSDLSADSSEDDDSCSSSSSDTTPVVETRRTRKVNTMLGSIKKGKYSA
jgi:hypothetical protein